MSRFRDFVTADGSTGYPAERGRYHLYVSLACPWAHRTIIYRHLKGLEDVISMTIVDPERDERGWAITDTRGHDARPGQRLRVPERGLRRQRQRLRRARHGAGAVGHAGAAASSTTSRARSSACSTASSTRSRSTPSCTTARTSCARRSTRSTRSSTRTSTTASTAPASRRTQAAYERSFGQLFDALDELDARLATRRYLLGDTITEADWRLFTTLLRFDPVYVGHFKCNLRRIVDYPQLSGYLRDLYQQPGIAATVDMDHIKRHYYRTHPSLNPLRIVPVGPALDLTAPHGRG